MNRYTYALYAISILNFLSCSTQTALEPRAESSLALSSSQELCMIGNSSSLSSMVVLSSQSQMNSSEHLISSNSSSFKGTYGVMKDDRDGQTYSTVLINNQEWMATNLNFGTFVSDEKNSSFVQKSGQKFCLDNYEPNCHFDGGLYQWHNALGLDSLCSNQSCSPLIQTSKQQGICPTGWHIPSSADWDSLDVFLGGNYLAGMKMKMNLTSYSTWNDISANDGNSSGFSALPVGYRTNVGYIPRGTDAKFWVSAETDLNNGKSRWLGQFMKISAEPAAAKLSGYSVRCLKD